MAALWSKIGLFVSLTGVLAPMTATGQDQPFRIGSSVISEMKYKPGFAHFDYVNPNAPKGGDLRLSASGAFDTFNPILAKGQIAAGLSLVYDTLMKPTDDELLVSYGLLAEGLSYPDDVSSATFRLRKEAKWADGQPITPDDVIFSLDKTKELNAATANYYRHVVKAEKTGDRDVTFTFESVLPGEVIWRFSGVYTITTPRGAISAFAAGIDNLRSGSGHDVLNGAVIAGAHMGAQVQVRAQDTDGGLCSQGTITITPGK